MNYKRAAGALPASYLVLTLATVSWVATVQDVEFHAVPNMAKIYERMPDGQVFERVRACVDIFARSDLPGIIDVSIDYGTIGPVKSRTAVSYDESRVLTVCPDNATVNPDTLQVKRH